MAGLAAFLDAALGELRNAHRGASAPDSPIEGQRWWDTSGGATAEILKRYTVAAGWVSILTMNVTAGTITAIHGIKDEDTMSSDSAVLPPSQQSVKAYVDIAGLVSNLKPTVNAAVNKLDVFTKSGGAVPDATNIIKVAIPDGNGHTLRSRAAAYLSGTSQIVLANAANYWSKGTIDAEIKTAWLYAIWDGTGIVWALGGYAGLQKVSTTTTATDDDYLLLEASSTYTRDANHYCVAVAKIRYEYDTGDDPDHTIQATVENSPRVIWNPKSDYGKTVNLATTITSGSNIDQSVCSAVVAQSGRYLVSGHGFAQANAAAVWLSLYIKTGSATYGSAVQKAYGYSDSNYAPTNYFAYASIPPAIVWLNAGETIHLGTLVVASTGNRTIVGDDTTVGTTQLTFTRID
jgi:hypothetical protein